MRAFRSVFLLWMLAMLAHMACAVGEDSFDDGANPDCDGTYIAAVEDDLDGTVDTSTPGDAPEVTLFAYVPGTTTKILQTYELSITLAPEFNFLGFGNAGASVGQYDFDFTNPNNHIFDPDLLPSDYRIPHITIDSNTAYADSKKDGVYEAGVDAIAMHTTTPGGSDVFTMILPSGGTKRGGHCSYFDTDIRFTLPAGVVQLPAVPGSYDVMLTATSVDPDTGDANDHQGKPPIVYQRTIAVWVPEPGASALGLAAIAPLAALARRRTTPRAR